MILVKRSLLKTFVRKSPVCSHWLRNSQPDLPCTYVKLIESVREIGRISDRHPGPELGIIKSSTLIDVKFVEQGTPLSIFNEIDQIHVLNEFSAADRFIIVSISFLKYNISLPGNKSSQ